MSLIENIKSLTERIAEVLKTHTHSQYLTKIPDTLSLLGGKCGGGTSAYKYPSLYARGHITIGDPTSNDYSSYVCQRLCTADGGKANQLKFFINSDGSNKFSHLRGPNDSGVQDAYLLYDATGFRASYSGTKGVACTEDYMILDQHNAFTILNSLLIFPTIKGTEIKSLQEFINAVAEYINSQEN